MHALRLSWEYHMKSSSNRPLALVTSAWLTAVIALGATGVAARALPLVPLLLVGPVVAWVLVYRRSPTWRARIDAVPLQLLIGLHIARAPIGLGLLLAYERGVLPEAFAIKAGWGDLVVGVAAIAAVLAARARSASRWLTAWNLLGAIDIAVAVGTAQYLFLVEREPLLTAGAPHLPFIVLPGFIVPVVLSTHVAIAARLRRGVPHVAV